MTTNTITQSNNLDKTTSAYPMVDVLICPARLAKTPDIATGSQRSRKYAVLMSLSAIPNLNEQPEPVMVKFDLPTILIDSDDMSSLRERCIQEIDGILEQMKIAIEEMKNEKNSKKIIS